jgi:2-polyprenyl-6-methoxyphenol hydroxylase-like FAD-dependent oxidoreductase
MRLGLGSQLWNSIGAEHVRRALLEADVGIPGLRRPAGRGDPRRDQLSGHRLMGQIDNPDNARWQSFRTVTNERWHQGNVVLLGDSAHTTHFSTGEGTTLAIEDAIALAENLDRHHQLETGLTAYEQQRRPKVRRSQERARLSAEFFANIRRYASLEPREFAVLLHARRSPLLPLLPPRLYYQVHRAASRHFPHTS